MAHNIYLFSIFGDLDKPAAGGGEAASRRLWHTMEEAGFNVTIFNRHRFDWSGNLRSKFLLCVWFVLDPIVLYFKLRALRKEDSVFIFRSYSGALLLFDFGLALAGKLAGLTTIMCLAGGRANPDYQSGNALYRWIFKKTLGFCHEVLCEGEVSCELVRQVTEGKLRTYYLPNFTERGFAPEHLPHKPESVVNIIYFGRICWKKEVLLGIDIFNRLCEKYNNLYYTIIGDGDEDYCKHVGEAVEASPYSNRIERFPSSSHDFIMEMLKSQHIFLFPSHEHCEGHSNAMNEAMSWGVIPVVSDINFLPDIVGRNELVVHGYDPEDYVRIISSLIDGKRLSRLSEYVFDRVRTNFTQDVIQNGLKEELLSI